MAATIKTLQKSGLWVFALDAEGDTPLFEMDLCGPAALVVGGEERGVRPLVKKHCDAVLSIPRTGAVLSLNAAAAGSIAMYEVFRQRVCRGRSGQCR